MMNTETLQWYNVADLPQPVFGAPGAVCGDFVDIMSLTRHTKSMYTYQVSALIQSCRSNPTANV